MLTWLSFASSLTLRSAKEGCLLFHTFSDQQVPVPNLLGLSYRMSLSDIPEELTGNFASNILIEDALSSVNTLERCQVIEKI